MNPFVKITLFPQYYENNGDIYVDGITLNEILLVLSLNYSLPNRANHMKVEDHMAPPIPSHHSQFPDQYPIYAIENHQVKLHSKIHAYKKLAKQKLINVSEIVCL